MNLFSQKYSALVRAIKAVPQTKLDEGGELTKQQMTQEHMFLLACDSSPSKSFDFS